MSFPAGTGFKRHPCSWLARGPDTVQTRLPTGLFSHLTSLNGGSTYGHSGTLAGPISWVGYRLWDGASAGPNDVANNFEISSMTISVPEPSALVLVGFGSGFLFLRRRKEAA